LNDHAQLREDLLLQNALERDARLASSANLCRVEHRPQDHGMGGAQGEDLGQFIASFAL
jgi:hypothetical protein